MKLNIFISFLLLTTSFCVSGREKYVGGDISLLPEYESAGAQYKDEAGQPISELLPFLKKEGMNAMRVRLFVNPKDYNGKDADPNACQDLNYIIPLCKRIKDGGFSLLLDFHYSDTWADPAKQWIPEAWKGLSEEELYSKIYDYTKSTLQTLREEGIVPDFIQPGNEISFGMLWGNPNDKESDLKKVFINNDANWDRFGKLLKEAIKACKEECPEAEIILHTERVGDLPVQNNFYNKMKDLGVEYDIIGLSYYPYFHGSLSTLNNALTSLETSFPDKEIMIVETGFPYKWEVPGTSQKVDYEYSDAGQNQFAKDLVATLNEHESVTGLFWWWLEYNAFNTNLSGWYNAPLFDSTTGKACSALKTICSFASGSGSVGEISTPNNNDDILYDLSGRIVDESYKGIIIKNGKKIVVK